MEEKGRLRRLAVDLAAATHAIGTRPDVTNRFRKRLSYRLTRDTVLVAMALGLVLNLIQITLDYFNARTSMRAEINAMIEISQSPAAQIAYNIDIRLAEELLDGLLRHPATIDARLVDSEGHVLASAHQNRPESPYRWVSDLLFSDSLRFSSELRVPQLEDLPLGAWWSPSTPFTTASSSWSEAPTPWPSVCSRAWRCPSRCWPSSTLS